MNKLIGLLVLVFFTVSASVPGYTEDEDERPFVVLETLHKAAAEADWDTYFNLFHTDATFIGTDVTEIWDIPTFQEYAARSKGWVYFQRSLSLTFSPDGTVAWFHEILDSQNYGTSRGTGVLILDGETWKIMQYHLTFPIPNDLAATFTDQIKTFEAKKR